MSVRVAVSATVPLRSLEYKSPSDYLNECFLVVIALGCTGLQKPRAVERSLPTLEEQ